MKKISFTLLLLLAHYITLVICNKCDVLYNVSDKIEYESNLKYRDSSTIKLPDGLRDDFYKDSCPCAESIVRHVVQTRVHRNPAFAAHLLRLHFHDCFVRGCDGSVLLNSTGNSPSERYQDIENVNLKGFELIEDIKAELEKSCPGVVSCADTLALAARDAVSSQYKKALWRVPTGRRDGRVSLASEVTGNVPSPYDFYSVNEPLFLRKGLSVRDMVTLSGAHTLGRAQCHSFDFRLWNFTSAPPKNEDPSLDKNYTKYLQSFCHNPLDRTTVLDMDPSGPTSFDNNYYYNLKKNKALLFSDSQLLTNGTREAREVIEENLQSHRFFYNFAISILKMGSMDVKTGSEGEIRRKCSHVNSFRMGN